MNKSHLSLAVGEPQQPRKNFISISVLLVGLTCSLMLISGCSSTIVRTTEVVPVIQENQHIKEALLLDVGVAIFDPGIEAALADDDEDNIVFSEIRNAEARYFPTLIMETLQASSAWGAVRVVPNGESAVDVLLQGTIIHSDGEVLIVDIKVTDASGKQWYFKRYEAMASRYSYDRKQSAKQDAFQNIYHSVANDLLLYRRGLEDQKIASLRTIAELRFAQSFAPQTFASHLAKDKQGQYVINSLPADNDPMITRVRQIRERDYLFIDTLQEYYGTFAKDMEQPYLKWRQESYSEVIALKTLKRSAKERIAAGTAALIGGILASSNSGSAVTRTAGSVAMAGGAYVIKNGIDKSSESKIHIEALQELGDSLEASIEPQVIELEDRTVTLSGTVDNQYQQWRELLHQIYQIDTTGQVNQ
ncbi:MAG: hypothetical protein ACI9FJ_002297 [Alteromonadaceae bacterium]|jgi:hypothetical protein